MGSFIELTSNVSWLRAGGRVVCGFSVGGGSCVLFAGGEMKTAGIRDVHDGGKRIYIEVICMEMD